jgi:hypothetical protein
MTSNTTGILTAVLLLACGAPVQAYQPGEVFRLDLKAAMLSPQPIGPPAQFEPVPVAVRAKDEALAEAPRPAAKGARAARAPAARAPRMAAKPRPAAKKQIARRSNPLDANAADTRMQVWPCRSGGICNWRK